MQMLDNVKAFAYELGGSPIHGEIDAEVKRALIRRCGSWRNALYQVGLEPVVRIRPFHGIYIDYRKKITATVIPTASIIAITEC